MLTVLLCGCFKDSRVAGKRTDIMDQLNSSGSFEPIQTPAMETRSSWGGPVKRNVVSPNFYIDDGIRESWSLQTNSGRFLGSPIIYEKKIITLDQNGKIQCLNLITKKVLWVYSILKLTDSDKIILGGGLSHDSAGNLLVTTSLGEILSISINDGSLNWRYKIDSPVMDSPVIIDNNIFIIDSKNSIRSLSLSGTLNWLTKGIPHDEIRSRTGTAVPAENLVIVPSSSGFLLALDMITGDQQWDFKFKFLRAGYSQNSFGSFDGKPKVYDDVIYFGSLNGQFNALKLNGEKLWQSPVGLQGSPLLISNSLFFISDRNNLVRLDRRNGSLIWKKKLGEENELQSFFSPILIGSRIWVARSSGKLSSFDVSTGELIEEFTSSFGIAGPPIYYSGGIILYTNSGKLVGFE